MTDYTIHLRHRLTDQLMDVVSLFTAAQYRRVRNDLGSFSVTLPWTDDDIFVRWRLGNIVDFYRHAVRDDGKIVQTWAFGGIITERKFTVAEGGEFLEVTGVSYLRWITGRVIFPFVDRVNIDPANGNPVRHSYHQVPFDQYYLYRDTTSPEKIHHDYKVTPFIPRQPPVKTLPGWFPAENRPNEQNHYTDLPIIPTPPAVDPYFPYRDPNNSRHLHPDYLYRDPVPEKPPLKQLPPGITEPLPPIPTLPLDSIMREFVRKHVVEGIGYEWKTQLQEPTDRPRPLIADVAHQGRFDTAEGINYDHSKMLKNWSGRFDQLLPLFQKLAVSVQTTHYPNDGIWFDVVREIDTTDPYYIERSAQPDFDPQLEASTFKSHLVFKTWTNYPGSDKTIGMPNAIIIDAQSGQITEVEYTESITDIRNWIVAIGGYKGAQGPTADAAAAFSWDTASRNAFGREEEYVNATSSDTSPAVVSQMASVLNDRSLDTSVTFTIVGEGQYIFGEDFDFGDKITVIWRSIELDQLITGVEVTLSEGKFADAKIAVGAKPFYYKNVAIRLGRHLRYILRAISDIELKRSPAWSSDGDTTTSAAGVASSS